MQTLLKRWTHALLEWLGLTSATGDALDRWAASVLVVLAAVHDERQLIRLVKLVY